MRPGNCVLLHICGGDQRIERGGLARGVARVKWPLPKAAKFIAAPSIVGPDAVGVRVDKGLVLGIGSGGIQIHQIAGEYALELRRIAT